MPNDNFNAAQRCRHVTPSTHSVSIRDSDLLARSIVTLATLVFCCIEPAHTQVDNPHLAKRRPTPRRDPNIKPKVSFPSSHLFAMINSIIPWTVAFRGESSCYEPVMNMETQALARLSVYFCAERHAKWRFTSKDHSLSIADAGEANCHDATSRLTIWS